MHLSHTLVLSSYRFSFNDTLPSSMVMNGCVVCFPRKGNNELLLSMQFIETCYPIRLPEELHRWLNFKNCDTIPMLSEWFLFSFWSNCCCIPASMEVFLFSLIFCETWTESIFLTFNASSRKSCALFFRFLIFHSANCLKNIFWSENFFLQTFFAL